MEWIDIVQDGVILWLLPSEMNTLKMNLTLGSPVVTLE